MAPHRCADGEDVDVRPTCGAPNKYSIIPRGPPEQAQVGGTHTSHSEDNVTAREARQKPSKSLKVAHLECCANTDEPGPVGAANCGEGVSVEHGVQPAVVEVVLLRHVVHSAPRRVNAIWMRVRELPGTARGGKRGTRGAGDTAPRRGARQ